MPVLPVKRGLNSAVITNIPDKWSKEWFRQFVQQFLTTADVRNGSAWANSNITVDTQLTGAVDPSTTPVDPPADGNAPVLAKGNTMPMVQTNTFTYTSTTTSITFTWPGYTVYRPDGTSFNMTAGSQVITGLTSNTTYTAFAYSSEDAPSTMMFAMGLVGTPTILFDPTATQAQLSVAFAQASMLGHIYQGKITGVTPVSGGGGGGGGGGGYIGPCPHQEQDILTKESGLIKAKDLLPGHSLLTPTGWGQIKTITPRVRAEWVGVVLDNKAVIACTPDHRFIQPDGSEIKAIDLQLGYFLRGKDRVLQVIGLVSQTEVADAISIELDYPHVYYMTEDSPLSHNNKP